MNNSSVHMFTLVKMFWTRNFSWECHNWILWWSDRLLSGDVCRTSPIIQWVSTHSCNLQHPHFNIQSTMINHPRFLFFKNPLHIPQYTRMCFTMWKKRFVVTTVRALFCTCVSAELDTTGMLYVLFTFCGGIQWILHERFKLLWWQSKLSVYLHKNDKNFTLPNDFTNRL